MSTDLKTIEGISDARTELYDAVKGGDIAESVGSVMERILRGQTYLHGDLPLKYIRLVMVLDKKGSDSGHKVSPAIKQLERFLGNKVKQVT